ncbi:radical SAM protein [bacterium]|nr:radical SAM protein [bacterium]
MKIALIQVEDTHHPNVYNDFAGGFGAGFEPGRGILTRLVGFAKHHGLDLPLMSFGYLAAIFGQAGHTVLTGRNIVPEADLIIIHSSMTGWRNQIKYARKVKASGKARVGFIGPFSAVKAELFLDTADFIIEGEPEQAAQRLAQGEQLSGLIDSSPIQKLDTLPFPDWSPFSTLRFSYFPSLLRRPVFPILSSRGCPDTCVYCPYKVQYKKFRARSPENVVAEMKMLHQKRAAAGFLFRDPFFSFSRSRTEKLAQLLLEQNIRVPWVCETKIESLDRELVLLLKRTGLRTINVGIESAKAEILERAGRTVYDAEQVRDLVNFCDHNGVKVAAFFILGWPDDTIDSIRATIDYAISLNPHIATFTLFTPFPGTPAFSEYETRLITDDWSRFDVMNPVYKHPHLDARELIACKERAYLKYYYRPRYFYSFFRRLLSS